MTNTKNAVTSVDSLAHRPTAQSYRLEHTFHVHTTDGVEIVRVQVHRDSYDAQSWGNVSVFNDERKWTTLAVADREVLAATSRDALVMKERIAIRSELGPIADDLLERAVAILSV